MWDSRSVCLRDYTNVYGAGAGLAVTRNVTIRPPALLLSLTGGVGGLPPLSCAAEPCRVTP